MINVVVRLIAVMVVLLLRQYNAYFSNVLDVILILMKVFMIKMNL